MPDSDASAEREVVTLCVAAGVRVVEADDVAKFEGNGEGSRTDASCPTATIVSAMLSSVKLTALLSAAALESATKRRRRRVFAAGAAHEQSTEVTRPPPLAAEACEAITGGQPFEVQSAALRVRVRHVSGPLG